MTIAASVAQAAVKTASGESISNGVWTLVGVIVTTIGIISVAVIKQWGPWKQTESQDRAADFDRLRGDIERQNQRIEKLESAVHAAEKEASGAKEQSLKSDAKLQTALTACELLLGLVEREMPDTGELALVKRLLAQAAADDMGIGSGMRKIAMMQGTGE